MSEIVYGDKQLQILIAAEKLIAEQGFQGLSMHKVAKAANMATGTIYRYFRDKDHLLIEVRLHVSQKSPKPYKLILEMTCLCKNASVLCG